MHELGIAFHIIKEVDQLAQEKGYQHVSKVTLEVGEVSSVIPSYLIDCWNWACEHRSKYLKGCVLNVITLKGISYCEDCKETYDTVPAGRTCPHCGSGNTYLVTGDEVTIQSIDVD